MIRDNDKDNIANEIVQSDYAAIFGDKEMQEEKPDNITYFRQKRQPAVHSYFVQGFAFSCFTPPLILHASTPFARNMLVATRAVSPS